MAATPAQIKATTEYLKKHNIARIEFRVGQAEKDQIKEMAKLRGFSNIKDYLVDLIEKDREQIVIDNILEK